MRQFRTLSWRLRADLSQRERGKEDVMPRLSLPIDRIKTHYSVVVIGSGYGGGIAASRLSRAGKDVCILERGREFMPGEFPDTQPEVYRELQTHLPELD